MSSAPRQVSQIHADAHAAKGVHLYHHALASYSRWVAEQASDLGEIANESCYTRLDGARWGLISNCCKLTLSFTVV